MKKSVLIAVVLGFATMSMLAQMPGDRGEASLEMAGGKVVIDYGRPSLGGRDIKAMIQPGMEWRMGSNAATTLSADVDLKFGDKSVSKGKYVLKAKFIDEGKWNLLVVKDKSTVAEVPLTVGNSSTSAEKLTITLEKKGSGAMFLLSWGNMTLSTPFQKA